MFCLAVLYKRINFIQEIQIRQHNHFYMSFAWYVVCFNFVGMEYKISGKLRNYKKCKSLNAYSALVYNPLAGYERHFN